MLGPVAVHPLYEEQQTARILLDGLDLLDVVFPRALGQSMRLFIFWLVGCLDRLSSTSLGGGCGIGFRCVLCQ